MGNQLSGAFCRRKSIQVHVLILGLHAAGKTSLLQHYVLGRHVHTVPSLIDNIETCKLNSLELTVLDVGNRMKSRVFLRHHYSHLKGLVFVVDSTNRERVGSAKEYLEEFLNEDELKHVPIAIALHKRDLDNCMTKEEMEDWDIRSPYYTKTETMSGVFDDNIPKGRGDSSQYQNLVGMDWRGTDNPNSGSI